MTKRQQDAERVALALRDYAAFMCNHPEQFSQEDGQVLDRALRSCPAISDLDVVWVRWEYVAQQYHWLTTGELEYKNGKYHWLPPEALTWAPQE